MSSRWLPKWKKLDIEVSSKKIDVCFDEITKLYACPLCSPSCLKGGSQDYGTYFFNLDDLKRHIISHKEAFWLKKKRVLEEEEEEGKISVGEEESEEE